MPYPKSPVWDFPGSPVVKNLPPQRNQDSACHEVQPKKKRKKKTMLGWKLDLYPSSGTIQWMALDRSLNFFLFPHLSNEITLRNYFQT